MAHHSIMPRFGVTRSKHKCPWLDLIGENGLYLLNYILLSYSRISYHFKLEIQY